MTEEINCCHVPECTTEVAVPGGAVASCMDHCIVPEVKMLWGLGVRTFCSCCGHGLYEKAYMLLSWTLLDMNCMSLMNVLTTEQRQKRTMPN